MPIVLVACAQSEDDKIVADTAATVKSCGEYAQLRVQANCTRFVEQGRDPNSAFGRNSAALVKALQSRWEAECPAIKGDLSQAEMKTTIAVRLSGGIKSNTDSTELCSAEASRQLKSFPALNGNGAKQGQ